MKAKKHIFIVVTSFAGGGAEKIAVNLANHYAAAGYKISLVVFKNHGPYRDNINKEVNIIDLKVTRTRYVFFKLLKELKKHKPFAVLSVIRDSNVILGITRFFHSGTRYIYREANTMDSYKERKTLNHYVYQVLMRVAYKNADAIIANSIDTRRDLLRFSYTDVDKCVVVSNPVLPPGYEALSEKEATHQWLNDEKLTTIINVGRLDKQKNQEMLLYAFRDSLKNLPDLRLLVLGEGAEKENLINICDELKITEKVDIIEFQKNPFPFYKQASLFVLSSRWEGFGNVLVEALACGTAVISTDCPGGPREILADGKYGKLVPNEDFQSMANAIVNHFSKKDTIKSTRQERIERGKKYSVAVIAKKYLDIIDPGH